MNNFDVIIVGAGLSGMYVALNLDPKLKVLLLSKGNLIENNSYLAQGGIAAVISNDDDFKNHIEDTIKAGSALNNLTALEVLVTKAKRNISLLEESSMIFDRDEYGNYLTTLEGGHSFKRILHAGGDETGRVLVEVLVDRIKKLTNLTIMEDVMVVDLLVNDNHCVGISLIHDNKFMNIFAQSTVLTTGGIGGVYKKTTNSTVATGDGVAIAKRANVDINNMEFIQFHPTVFYEEGKTGKHFLISEAVRGEGAYLININGERFMTKYHRDLELAPRDVVSQAIFNELKETNSKFIYLDIRHQSKEFLEKRFPSIYKYCLDKGLDMSNDLIPVSPAEHYSIGGISININGQTSLDNLYASGECADSGVHGANRLASNSLLECLVFGRAIAKTINKQINHDELALEIETISKVSDDHDYTLIRKEIQEIMQSNVGIVRTTIGLKKALTKLNKIYKSLIKQKNITKQYYEILNMTTVALLITEAALKRTNSIGCHLRVK